MLFGEYESGYKKIIEQKKKILEQKIMTWQLKVLTKSRDKSNLSRYARI